MSKFKGRGYLLLISVSGLLLTVMLYVGQKVLAETNAPQREFYNVYQPLLLLGNIEAQKFNSSVELLASSNEEFFESRIDEAVLAYDILWNRFDLLLGPRYKILKRDFPSIYNEITLQSSEFRALELHIDNLRTLTSDDLILLMQASKSISQNYHSLLVDTIHLVNKRYASYQVQVQFRNRAIFFLFIISAFALAQAFYLLLREMKNAESLLKENQLANQQLAKYSVDLTNKVRLRTTELEVALIEAEHANEARGNFLAHMSHELRTPLNAISGMSELVLDTELDEQQLSHVQTINIASDNLLDLINNVLDFSKIDNNHLQLEAMDFSLNDLIKSVLTSTALRATEKKIDLLVDVDRTLPTLYQGDLLRLRQVLVNLVGNAIKFTKQGEVRLKIQRKQILKNRVVINFSVQDSGIGMTTKEQENIFKAFGQADQSTTRQFGGTGLGLSISQSLVKLMGGIISVNSTKNIGSEFSFSITLEAQQKYIDPIMDELHVGLLMKEGGQRDLITRWLNSIGCNVYHANEQSLKKQNLWMIDYEYAHVLRGKIEGEHIFCLCDFSQTLAIESAKINDVRTIYKPINPYELTDAINNILHHKAAVSAPALEQGRIFEKRILVVEDNIINQKIAQKMLEKSGAKVTIANNGKQGIEKLNDGQYDLVLLDLQMPIMDGYEAISIIRKNKKWDSLPVLALTAHAFDEEQQRCEKAGMNGFLTKPFKNKVLISTVENLLSDPL